MKPFLTAIIVAFVLALSVQAKADYWCPGNSWAEVGIFSVGPAFVPYRYCESSSWPYGDFYMQQITWSDYWDLKGMLGE